MVIVYGSGFRTRPEGQARIYFVPAYGTMPGASALGWNIFF